MGVDYADGYRDSNWTRGICSFPSDGCARRDEELEWRMSGARDQLAIAEGRFYEAGQMGYLGSGVSSSQRCSGREGLRGRVLVVLWSCLHKGVIARVWQAARGRVTAAGGTLSSSRGTKGESGKCYLCERLKLSPVYLPKVNSICTLSMPQVVAPILYSRLQARKQHLRPKPNSLDISKQYIHTNIHKAFKQPSQIL